MSNIVTIYTDGAARGNPGPGGYGTILLSGTHRKELSAGYRLTTNNRMELMAVIAGLEALKKDNCLVTVYSDSKYVVDSVEKGWVFEWERQNFRKRKNRDLWETFLKLYRKHKIIFKWLKGHANNPLNEKCDIMAVEASKGTDLLNDEGYDDTDHQLI